MDDGWATSADAWIKEQSDGGDYARRLFSTSLSDVDERAAASEALRSLIGKIARYWIPRLLTVAT